jgi:hypothetical protein
VGSPVTSMFSFTVQGTAAWTAGRRVTALVAEQEKLPGEVTEEEAYPTLGRSERMKSRAGRGISWFYGAMVR